MTPARLIFATLVLATSLAGCNNKDPFDRPGTWKPPEVGQSVNDANLRVMIDNPHDLVQGASEPGIDGREAVAAVSRLYQGCPKQMGSESTRSSGGGSGGGTAAGGGCAYQAGTTSGLSAPSPGGSSGGGGSGGGQQ